MDDIVSGVDVDALRNLFVSNAVSNIAFNIFKERENDSKETKLDRLEDLIREKGESPQRVDIVSLMKGLQDAGCGRFIVGRRGAPSRFEWRVSLRSIGLVATSASNQVDQLGPSADDTDGVDEMNDQANDSGSIVHAFVLRPDCRVKFVLPIDLTVREAKRLAYFLRTLPFNHIDDLDT